MKKINSARQPSPPVLIDLARGIPLYSIGKDSPDKYLVAPGVVYEFKKPRFVVEWMKWVNEDDEE